MAGLLAFLGRPDALPVGCGIVGNGDGRGGGPVFGRGSGGRPARPDGHEEEKSA